MKTIYKYEIDTVSNLISSNNQVKYDIKMPHYSKILSAKIQHGKLCIWVMTDPTYELETRSVFVIGTGWPMIDVMLATRTNIDDDIEFIDTVVLADGQFVYHIFG